MGMDVMGKNPTDEKGGYFRNNVWWWSPLWDYCSTISPEICKKVKYAYSNDGDGLDALDSEELSKRLYKSLKDGTADKYVKERNDHINSLPKRKCLHCMATGMRLWYKNKETGKTRNPYDYDFMADVFGDGQKLPKYTKLPIEENETEISQTCNGCSGKGETEPRSANYSIDVENIRAFARFLKTCGGFSIC
jgi:hypothetical protein